MLYCTVGYDVIGKGKVVLYCTFGYDFIGKGEGTVKLCCTV